MGTNLILLKKGGAMGTCIYLEINHKGAAQGCIFVFISYNSLGKGFQFLAVWERIFEKLLKKVQKITFVSIFGKKEEEKSRFPAVFRL